MLMATAATRPPGASPFSGTARRAVLEPEARRTCNNGRRCSNVSKVLSSTTTTPNTTTLSEANGPVMDTFSRRGLFHVLDQEATEMNATVTVHIKSVLKRLRTERDKWGLFLDLVHTSWLYLELVGSELDPKTKLEHPVSSWAKHSRNLENEVQLFEVSFTVPASFGPIGAVHVRNDHHSEMLLGDINVFPAGQESSAVTFHCNSWIQPTSSSPDMRTFFPLKHSYLPSQTPKGVDILRRSELEAIRGDDGNSYGERKVLESIYDYDVYNDLSNPDHDLGTKRPVLGGKEHPYPSRCRTGRPRSKADLSSEVRAEQQIYVPRDEAFTERKEGAFNTKLHLQMLRALTTLIKTSKHSSLSFPSLVMIDDIYDDGFRNKPRQKEGDVSAAVEILENELLHLVKLEGKKFVEEIQRVLKFETPAIHDSTYIHI